jgi:hypothetical protein
MTIKEKHFQCIAGLHKHYNIEEQGKHFEKNWKDYWKFYPGATALYLHDLPTPIICRDVDEIRNVLAAKYGHTSLKHYSVSSHPVPSRLGGLLKIIWEKAYSLGGALRMADYFEKEKLKTKNKTEKL